MDTTPEKPVEVQTQKLSLGDWKRQVLGSHPSEHGSFEVEALWDLGGGVTHIGLASDRQTAEATPLVIHNIGSGVKEEDILLRYRIIGQYRPQFASQKQNSTKALIPNQ